MIKNVGSSRLFSEQARVASVTLVLLSMIAPVIPAPQGQLPPIPDLARRTGNFDLAVQKQIQQSLKKLQLNPESAKANGNLAMVLHAHLLYELAEPLYIRAQRLDPSSFPWAYYLGVIRAPLGKQSKSAPILRLAVGLKPDYLPARLALADTLQELGELEESREIYRQILQDHPQSTSAYAGLGRVSWEKGDVAAAIKNYKKACELFPEFGAGHYALGLAYRSLENMEKSREHLSLFKLHSAKKPLLKDPVLDAIQALISPVEYFLHEGSSLREKREFGEAATAFEEVLQIEPHHAIAHANLVQLYIALGDTRKVEEHYREAVAIAPGLYETHYNFGTYLAWSGRTVEAIEALTKALEVNPFHATSHSNLGYLLDQQGKSEEAEKHYLLAIQYEPNFALPHFNMGRLLMARGQPTEAIVHLQQTLQPENEAVPLHIYTLALAHAQIGDLETSREYALQAKEKAVGPVPEQVTAAIEELLTYLNQVANPDGQ